MKIIFAGTPEFAATALAAILSAGHEVVAVLTQPDRPAGRRRGGQGLRGRRERGQGPLARDGDGDVLAADPLVVGRIEALPAGARHVDLGPGMGRAMLAFTHLDVAGDKARG